MPRFGDFVTVGEPLRTSEQPGYFSTIWKAQWFGDQIDRFFAVKVILPRQGDPPPAESGEARDPTVPYVEGFRVQKNGHLQSAAVLAPIHAFGKAGSGVWYATDYYSRKSLREFISFKGHVDSRMLQNIIYHVVAGCLALQRATGRSHGNIKPGNILLADKRRPLRDIPLHLVDPRPSAFFHTPSDASEALAGAATAGKSVEALAEKSDLRAIGELICQLVEGRLTEGSHSVAFPVAASVAWKALGADAERWRDLCNRLGNPQLSLADVNLEALAKELRPSPRPRKGLLILVAAALIAPLAWAMFHRSAGDADLAAKGSAVQTPVPPSNEALLWRQLAELRAAGRQAEEQHAWPNATSALAQALQRADELRDKTQWQEIREELDFALAMEEGERLLKDARFKEAEKQANVALALKPQDVAATDLLARAGQTTSSSPPPVATGASDLEKLMANARDAEGKANWAQAAESWGQALRQANELKDQAQRAAISHQLEYVQAMQAGTHQLEERDYPHAIESAQKALTHNPGNAAADALRHQAEQASQAALAQIETERKLTEIDSLVSSADTALREHNWTKAAELLNRTLLAAETVPAPGKMEAARTTLKYAQAMERAQKLLDENSADAAEREIAQAIAVKPDDVTAKDLQRRAVALRSKLEADRSLRERQSKVDQLLATGRNAVRLKQWADAADQFNQALGEATNLSSPLQRTAIQRELDYSRGMDAGEKLLLGHQAEQALAQATKLLADNPADLAASDLKERAEAAQGVERDVASAQAALDRGDYDEVARLAQAHPRDDRFPPLTSQAEDEKRSLRAAEQQFAAGDYGFLTSLQIQPSAKKAPFATLLLAARKEQDELAALQALRDANKAEELRGRIARLPDPLRAKPPFDALGDWAESAGAVAVSAKPVESPPAKPAEPGKANLAGNDKLLDYWEYLLNVRKPPPDVKVEKVWKLTRSLRTFYLEQLAQMESEYKAAGRLDGKLKRRLDILRLQVERLAGGSPATSPVLQPGIEPYIAPVHPSGGK